jgi:hypothetical protein
MNHHNPTRKWFFIAGLLTGLLAATVLILLLLPIDQMPTAKRREPSARPSNSSSNTPQPVDETPHPPRRSVRETFPLSPALPSPALMEVNHSDPANSIRLNGRQVSIESAEVKADGIEIEFLIDNQPPAQKDSSEEDKIRDQENFKGRWGWDIFNSAVKASMEDGDEMR